MAFGIALLASAAWAAELDGVALPDTRHAGGSNLRLNGMGLRTYSVFGIHIYVAGLYLESTANDGDAVLRSDQTKLLEIRFVHDVDLENARKAWIDGFAGNCKPPCHLPAQEVSRFLAAVPPFRRGDGSTLLFTRTGVEVAVNGEKLGTVTDAEFARVILATFIGHAPPTDRLKRELLGQR